MMEDARRFAPSAARNRNAILQALSPHLPLRGQVLEIASGSGEHITHFASAHPNLTFHPTEPDPVGRASIDAWTRHLDLQNVAPAIAFDVTQTTAEGANGPRKAVDVIICINMIHIAPWLATVGLLSHAATLLPKGGILYLYGPYRRDGAHTAPSNAAFDADLRARDPNWGVRDLEVVATLASEHGFGAPVVEAMPANNVSVVFRRQ